MALVPRTTRNPVASIVVPTHGAWPWTSRTLAAVREHTELPYELIVCDNASGDETPERLAAVTDARVVFNTENLGFSTACNQGAARARAPCIVFLNSDAIPHEGWLTPLVDCLARDPSVGAVGSRLLNRDGSLQEAGSTVLADGMTVRHGDGAEAVDGAFAFPRCVDFVSGACLATRRATFHEVGGFDSAFGLGYFEDVDLCFRLRSAGYRIVYQPDSVLTHGRGSSSGHEVKTELFARNQRLFVTRWRRELAGRLSLAESEHLMSPFLRDLSAEARILVLPERDRTPLHSTIDELIALLPHSRIAVLGSALPDLTRSAERADSEDAAPWLRERRFLFDVVLALGSDSFDGLADLLEETQPQACHLILDRCDGRTAHDLAATLAAVGVGSQVIRRRTATRSPDEELLVARSP